VEPNEALFVDLVDGLSFLENVKVKEDLHNIEAIIVLRIINNLGYIGDQDVLKTFIRSPFEENMVLEASKNRKIILSEINKALKETHM
jgi:hypothetical protein